MIQSLAQREPALACTVLTMIAGLVSGLVGHPEFSPVFVACGLALLGVRAKVTPVAKADAQITEAATLAVKSVASPITGPVGEITAAGVTLVNEVTRLVKR